MPSYLNYYEWLADLNLDPVSQLWMAKFRFDIAHNNLPLGTESVFMTVFNDNLHRIKRLPNPASVIHFVINHDPSSFDLQGQRQPAAVESYSCIMKLEVYVNFYLNRRVFSTKLDEGDEDLDFIWDNLDSLAISRFHIGELKTEREFFWCTPTELIQLLTARYTLNKGATVIRTRLGLNGLHKGQRVIRIDIPPSALLGKRMRAPTSLDGGVNPVFVPSKSKDGYGRSLNLRKCQRDLKELVVEKIPLTNEMSVQRQGRIGASCPSVSYNTIEGLVI